MAKFKVAKFNGMAPAISARLLSNDYAQSATNVDFLSGRLEPIKTDNLYATSTTNITTNPIQSIYPYRYKGSSTAAANYIAAITLGASAYGNQFFAYDAVGFSRYNEGFSFGNANPLEFALASVYVLSSSNSINPVLTIITRPEFSANPEADYVATIDHFKPSGATGFGFFNVGDGSALTDGPTVTNLANASESGLNFYDYGDYQLWSKTITITQFNAVKAQYTAGNVLHAKFTAAAVTASDTESLGTTHKSYLYKPALLADLQYPPARYIAKDYNGVDNYVFSEYIKIAGDQRSKLNVGATLEAVVDGATGAPKREAEVLYYAYDGTDTTIFFKRTHHIATGTVTGGTTSATNLIDGTSGAVVNVTVDNGLIGFSVTNYGVRNRAFSLIAGSTKSTGYITDSDESDNKVVADLFTVAGDPTGVYRTDSRYVISAEPDITKHTVTNPIGSYWEVPGIQACYTGFFNSVKLSGTTAPSDYGGVTNSQANSKTGLGFDPYFASRDTVTTKSMLRSMVAGTTYESATVGDTVNYWYGAPIVGSGTVAGKQSDTEFRDSVLAGLFNGNDELNTFTFHNLTKRSSATITDYVASNGALIFGTLSGGDDATITNGDSYEITASTTAYSYEWRSYHKRHPLSSLGGSLGNMGTILAPVEALTSDHVATANTDRTADDAGTPGNDAAGSPKITLSEGDIVQFKGWGVDATKTLQNNVNDTGNQTGDGQHYTTLNYKNSEHGADNAAAPYYRDVFFNMNWRRIAGEGITEPRAESHTVVAYSDFDVQHGGPYWQIIDDPVKVHIYNGLITVFGTNQTIVTGQHTASGASASVLTDAFKNFEPNFNLLIGRTIVNTTRGWSATITANTNTTITFADAAYYDLSGLDPTDEHIAAEQDNLQFELGDEYYIQQPLPGLDTLGGQILTEEFYNFRLLSVASLDKTRHVYTEATASFGVSWFCSRYADATVSVKRNNKADMISVLEFDNKVYVAKSPVDSDKFNRIYWTGQDYPRIAGGNIVPLAKEGDATVAMVNWAGSSTDNSFRLGIPTPQRGLVATNTGGVIDSTSVSEVLNVSYVYTYVSVFGEEGPPSPPTLPILYEFGQEVVLTNIGATETTQLNTNPEYNFGTGALKRIYRSNTGSTDTLYQFLGEIPFSKESFTDNVAGAELGEVLPSSTWVGPPNDDIYVNPAGPLRGLKELANGIFAGFTGRRICFSEPFLPHAWPVEYRSTVENDIIGLGAVANGVFVLTTGKPYFFSGNDPSAIVGTQIDFAQGCINVNSIVDMGDSVYYAGPDGLCRINTSGSEILTGRILSYSAWTSTFKANSYIAQRHESKYVALFETDDDFNGFVIDPASPDSALSLISRARSPSAVYNDEGSDNLYIVEDVASSNNQAIQIYRGGNTDTSYSWQSKKFISTMPLSMSWVGVYADSYPVYSSSASATPLLEVTVIVDGVTIFKANLSKNSSSEFIQETTTPSSVADTKLYQPLMRLPNNFGEEFEVKITGDVPVNEICLSQSMEEVINQ